MPLPVPCAHASGMADDKPPEQMPTAALSAFVVELRAAGRPAGDIRGMHEALMYAVARLRAGGVAITAGRSLLLQGDARCLCLLLAAGEPSVVLARDTAGLGSASVYQAVALPDGGEAGDWGEFGSAALGGAS
jgi:hypothetical protein